MSLNNISLPSQLLADLYHHTLIGDTATAVPQTTPVSFLGKNGKQILIVVNQPEVPYLPDSELSFLTKILTACQLGLVDVAIVNWSKIGQNTAGAVIEQLQAKAVILFDVDPTLFGLPANLPPFSVVGNDEVKYVAAPALQQIEKTREAKNQLWMALKQV
ncbi:MAG TPA: hypothetical protein VFL47_02090, partial [Flavisolibacter sp.]|nr:hypothetical protein [Flavisolibacter sp.]